MKTRTMIVLTLLALLALPITLFAQETADAEAVVQELVETFNAEDVDAALALHAEDAVVDIRPRELAPDAPYEGHEGIRTWLEQDAALNARVEMTDWTVEDDLVTATFEVTSDQITQLGLESVEGTSEILIEDGKIVSHTFTFSGEAVAQMQAAMAAAEAPGFTAASAAGDWALTYTIGPKVAAGVGTCAIDGEGNLTCSAIGSFPGENGQRMRIANDESGTFTVSPSGMLEATTTRVAPDGSEATFHYDCVVTEAEMGDSGLRADEFACIQQEPADPSGTLSTSMLRRLQDTAATDEADLEALYRGLVEDVLNQKNLDALDEYASQDFIDHNAFPGQEPGLEGVKSTLEMFFAAFPDAEWSIDHLVAQGDLVVAHGTMHGTHEGEIMGIPATGEEVTLTFFDMGRVEGGQFVERWGLDDTLGLMQQIGAMPQQ